MDGLDISWLKTIWWPTSEVILLLSDIVMVAIVVMDVPCDGMTLPIDASLDIFSDIFIVTSMNTLSRYTAKLCLCCWISSECRSPPVTPISKGNIPVSIGGDPWLCNILAPKCQMVGELKLYSSRTSRERFDNLEHKTSFWDPFNMSIILALIPSL